MEQKKNPYMYMFFGLLIIVILYLVNSNIQPLKAEEGTYIKGGHLDVQATGFNSSSYPGQMDVKTDVNGSVVYLGGSRFAIINNNESSSGYGLIMIYEYDEKTRKLNYLTSDSYVARMNQRTE